MLAALCAQAGPSRGRGNGVSWGWLDWGMGKCTDLPRIPTEIHLFVLKQEEKEEQAGSGPLRQQMARILEPWLVVWVSLLVAPEVGVCLFMGHALVSPGMQREERGVQ